MNALLIHNDNLPLDTRNSFKHQLAFNIPQSTLLSPKFSFDKEVDEQLEANLLDKKYDVIFIPYNLSDQNYLEMTGIRIALHIRLTSRFNHIYTPIIFIGADSVEEIAKLSEYQSFLFTTGVFSTKKFDYNSLRKQFEWIKNEWKPNGSLAELNPEEYGRVLTRIHINPSANYQSHHSTANEWAIFRYFSMLKVDENNVNYQNLKEDIENLDYLKSLHFKYKEALYNRQKINPKKHLFTPKLELPKKITIGVIEDESRKGWGNFYKYLIEKAGGQVIFFEFKKGEVKNRLIKRINDWVRQKMTQEKPIDVFIVDIRLHDDDFSENLPTNLTGVQATKSILKINKGAQVVLSTATNKIWNFQALSELDFKLFAIKESPELVSTRGETKNSLMALSKAIQHGVDKSYLAEFYRTIERLKNEHYLKQIKEEEEFKTKVFDRNGILDQLFNLLILDDQNEAILHQSLLLCFQIIEMYCDLKTVGIFDYFASSGKVQPKNGGNLIEVFNYSKDGDLITRLELIRGKYDWQTSGSKKTIKTYKMGNEMKLIKGAKTGIDGTALLKMISVFHLRENIDQNKIESLIALRYYRSNVAAHYTGRIDGDKFAITAKKDISFMIDIFENIFLDN